MKQSRTFFRAALLFSDLGKKRIDPILITGLPRQIVVRRARNAVERHRHASLCHDCGKSFTIANRYELIRRPMLNQNRR